MVFMSLQNLKNTYKYTFEKSNLLSKNTYNLFYLYFFFKNYCFDLLFSRYYHNLKIKFFKIKFFKKNFQKKNELKYYLNNYFFYSSNWCIFLFNFILLPTERQLRTHYNIKYTSILKNSLKNIDNDCTHYLL